MVMRPPDILFPNRVTLKALASFSRELQNLPERRKLVIGCGHLKFVTPTALIFLSKACAQRGRAFPDEMLAFRGLNKLEYANNLGFSSTLNLKNNPYHQGAFGGKSYIPISQLTRERVENRAIEMETQFGDAINSRCEEIAQVVSQGRSASLKSALSRTFCEIMRNTFEHSEADSLGFCAQHWPSSDEVEICITDRGIGLKNSLLQGKFNLPEDDKEAVYYSLMPGVSSKAWRHKKKRASQKSEWDNAGYGLFFSSQLFGSLGHFYIATGNHSLLLTPDRMTDYPCHVDGTLVSLRINLANEERIAQVLKEIVGLAADVKARLGVKSLNFKSVEGFLRTSSF